MKLYTKKICVLLLASGYIYGAKSTDTNSLFMNMAKHGNEVNLRNLLKHKNVDINTINADGESALYVAAKNGHETTVKLLLDKGSDVNLKVKGSTVLLHACDSGYKDVIVKMLLDSGASSDVSNEYGVTALTFAACTGHKTIVQILLNTGTNINTNNCDFGTALHFAVMGANLDIVKILLCAGADKTLKNYKGELAVDMHSLENITTIIKNFPSCTDLLSLKQTIINMLRKDKENTIKLPNKFPKLLLQAFSDNQIENWNLYKAKLDSI